MSSQHAEQRIHFKSARPRTRAVLITWAALAAVMLTGCGVALPPLPVPRFAVEPTYTAAIPSETPPIPAASATPTLNYKELAIVQDQATYAALRTEVALTAAPTRIPGPPPPYLGPTETPVLGLLRGCANTNSLEPYMTSCWAGIYNGNIVNVSSGREGRAGDMTQGLVMVYNRDTQDLQLYQTPDKVGAVKITAINGTLFTLTTVDHQPTITYTFDLATRQWVSSTP